MKNLPASAGDVRDACSIPGSGRSPGEGNGNPLQYSCLENSMDRGAWYSPWGHNELDTAEQVHVLSFFSFFYHITDNKPLRNAKLPLTTYITVF